LRGIGEGWARSDDAVWSRYVHDIDLLVAEENDEDDEGFYHEGYENLDEYERDAIEFFEERELQMEMNSEDGL